MRGYKSGNIYAEFVTVVERNQAQFNTEDRSKQYDWGEGREKVFLVVICQGTGHDICTLGLLTYINILLKNGRLQNTEQTVFYGREILLLRFQ